jgi:hypothetical protein
MSVWYEGRCIHIGMEEGTEWSYIVSELVRKDWGRSRKTSVGLLRLRLHGGEDSCGRLVMAWCSQGFGKAAAAPFRVGVTEGQYVRPKRRWLPTTLHGVTSLKTTNEFA